MLIIVKIVDNNIYKDLIVKIIVQKIMLIQYLVMIVVLLVIIIKLMKQLNNVFQVVRI